MAELTWPSNQTLLACLKYWLLVVIYLPVGLIVMPVIALCLWLVRLLRRARMAFMLFKFSVQNAAIAAVAVQDMAEHVRDPFI